jgi:hypothetical protein
MTPLFASFYEYVGTGYGMSTTGFRTLSIHIIFFFFLALQSLKDLGRLTYSRFRELFGHMVGLLGRVISPSQGLYQRRTTQHRKMRTNIHALSGIRTHDPSNQPAKTLTSDRTATVTGICYNCVFLKLICNYNIKCLISMTFNFGLRDVWDTLY